MDSSYILWNIAIFVINNLFKKKKACDFLIFNQNIFTNSLLWWKPTFRKTSYCTPRLTQITQTNTM